MQTIDERFIICYYFQKEMFSKLVLFVKEVVECRS